MNVLRKIISNKLFTTNLQKTNSISPIYFLQRKQFQMKTNLNSKKNYSIKENKEDLSLSEKINTLSEDNNHLFEENNSHLISQIENSNLDKKKDFYSQKFDKAKELLNYINIQYSTIKIEDALQVLMMCVNFKCYPSELIPKLEKTLTKVISNMNEIQLTKTIYGFAMINYHTKNLNFFYERALTKHVMSFATKNFNTIFKSLAKINFNTHGILYILRNYINKNINKFNLRESCDIFCNYNRLIRTPQEEDKIIIKILFTQISPHLVKLSTPKLINFYFIVFSQKSRENTELYVYIHKESMNSFDVFFDLFNERKNEITHRLAYLIVLCGHFTAIEYEGDMRKASTRHIGLIHEIIEVNMEYFTPDEINTIVTIFVNNKKNFPYEHLQRVNLFKKFVEVASNDIAEMNDDEILLYLQSLLLLDIDVSSSNVNNLDKYPSLKLTEAMSKFREEIFNKRINSFKLNHFATFIELIHHFKPQGSEEITIYINNLNLIADGLLKCIDCHTSQDLMNIFDDYYLIVRFLFDLKYENKKFWEKYLKLLEIHEALDKESTTDYDLQKISVIRQLKLN